MKYNPKIHKRKSIRLKGYDYAQAGLYFVTICCQNREHFYGNIENGVMVLNEPGIMIEKWYYELENKFSDIKCREMVVMPNHFHCIIENVGATLVVDPINNGQPQGIAPTDNPTGKSTNKTIGEIIGAFKSITTNEYIRGVKTKNWKRFDGKLWQRNYWEHIIRNEKSYYNISDYIKNNPMNWETDLLFLENNPSIIKSNKS